MNSLAVPRPPDYDACGPSPGSRLTSPERPESEWRCMFSGQDSIKIHTDLPFRKVLDQVEQHLDILGPVHMEDNGEFEIKGTSSDSFVEVKYTGWVEERKSGRGYEVEIRYTMNPTTVGIVLAVVMALVLLPLIVIPFLTVNSIQGKINRQMREALEDLQDALENA